MANKGKMDKRIEGLIYYTPVEDPSKIQKIEINSKEKLEAIADFIEKCTKKKRSPEIEPLTASGLNENIGEQISSIRKNFPSIQLSSVEQIFNILTTFAYGRSKTSNRYWGLIINSNFMFIYHFTPEKGFTFSGNTVTEFVKYLDNSTLSRFIFLTNKENMNNFYDLDPKEYSDYGDKDDLIYSYDQTHSKGFEEFTTAEPVYETMGEVKIRSKFNEDTDLVIETQTDNLSGFRDSINIDFEKGKADINVSLNVFEYEIKNKKYDPRDNRLFINHVNFVNLSIEKFLSEVKFYIKKHKGQISALSESKDHVSLDEGNKTIKKIAKPRGKLDDNEAIYVLGSTRFFSITVDQRELLNNVKNILTNEPKLNLTEASSYSHKYDLIRLGDLKLFLKFKDKGKLIALTDIFNKLLVELKGGKNDSYKKILSLTYLSSITDYMYSKPIRNVCKNAAYLSLKEIFSKFSKSKPNIQLKEVDKLGIEFKAGDLGDGRGFFDTSPEKFAEKLKEKFAPKKKDMVIFLVGINEDSKDLSPIKLTYARNEFIEVVKNKLNNANIHCSMLETIPVSKKEGILIVVLQKTK